MQAAGGGQRRGLTPAAAAGAAAGGTPFCRRPRRRPSRLQRRRAAARPPRRCPHCCCPRCWMAVCRPVGCPSSWSGCRLPGALPWPGWATPVQPQCCVPRAAAVGRCRCCPAAPRALGWAASRRLLPGRPPTAAGRVRGRARPCWHAKQERRRPGGSSAELGSLCAVAPQGCCVQTTKQGSVGCLGLQLHAQEPVPGQAVSQPGPWLRRRGHVTAAAPPRATPAGHTFSRGPGCSWSWWWLPKSGM